MHLERGNPAYQNHKLTLHYPARGRARQEVIHFGIQIAKEAYVVDRIKWEINSTDEFIKHYILSNRMAIMLAANIGQL